MRRPTVDEEVPLLVTMPVAGVPSLRSPRCIGLVRTSLREHKQKRGFRLIHYAVQPAHLSLIVEARDKRALSSGLRGLTIAVARRLNFALDRRGMVFSDRYHTVELRSAEEVRRALVEVLLQERRRAAQRGKPASVVLDPCSSAPLFDGWKGEEPRDGPWRDTVAPPQSALLTTAWRRLGRIDPTEGLGQGE